MIEPVAPNDFVVTFFAAAAVILFGAGYAGFYAWSKISRRRGWLFAAWACYGVLAVATFLLAQSAHLTGAWQILVALMLVGYLLAPVGIWKLCDNSH